MNRIPHRLAALLLTLALMLALIAPGFALQGVPEDSSAPAAQSEQAQLAAEPDSSAEPDPEFSVDGSAEPDSSAEPAPDNSAEPEQPAEPVPNNSTEPENAPEPTEAPEVSEAPAEAAPEDSAEAVLEPQEEEAPAVIWWQTDKDSYAERVDYEYNGSERKSAYRVMRDGAQVEVPASWTEHWFSDEQCTVPATDFTEVGTRWLRLMEGETVRAQGSYRIVKAAQRITAANAVVQKLFKSKSTFQLGAKSSGDGKLSYVSSDPTVVSVNSSGRCTMLRVGTATITVTAKETAHHRQATGTISIALYKKARKLSYSKSYHGSKYYKALANLKLTGTTGQNAVDIALSQLGYREGRKNGQLSGYGRGTNMSNWTEYGRYYGLNHQPWCAMFVSWCAREAGASYAAVPKYCACRYYHSYFKRKGQFHSWKTIRSGGYRPKKGDIILYAYSKGGVAHHIGFVLGSSYENSRVKLTTVEGNTNDRVKKVAMNFSSRSAGKHSGHYILGVASPKW